MSKDETLRALNDNSLPANSSDTSKGAYANLGKPNTLQWVQYTWPEYYSIKLADVYWLDGATEVGVPTNAYLEYWNNEKKRWLRIGNMPKQINAFNKLSVASIKTQALRLSIQNPKKSTGVLEWRVFGERTGEAAPAPIERRVPDSDVFKAMTNQYEFHGITTQNSAYKDSNRFRAFYAANGKNGGPNGLLAEVSQADIDIGLNHLEAAYECFIDLWGFTSPALNVEKQEDSPFYKMNVYSRTTGNTAMFENGWAFFETDYSSIAATEISVHEWGHAVTYAQKAWNSQHYTGQWWEGLAEWFADTYQTDPLCEEVRERRGLPISMKSMLHFDNNFHKTFLTLVHRDNKYDFWPFFTYLTNNPDNYSGLGRMVVKALFDNHTGNDESPLRVLAGLTDVPVQTILGRYWARIAYFDFNNAKISENYFNALKNASFRSKVFTNYSDLGGGRYRVLADRRPMYGGSTITPLKVTDTAGNISLTITKLSRQVDSNFTATLSVRNKTNGATRYLDLPNGSVQAKIAPTEEVSLVVVNTHNTLIEYDAEESEPTSPESIGLDYEVKITGASLTYLK